MSEKFFQELNQVLKDNKNKLKEINNKKSEKSKQYTDRDLEFLWAYYMNQLRICGYLSPFDLIRKEHAYCIYKIFGLDSCKLFLKDTEYKKEQWNNKSNRRLASEIVLTYRRRGHHFLRNSLIPKFPTDFQKKIFRYLWIFNKRRNRRK